MNKSLTERFQQLAGIKPLYEQDAQPLIEPINMLYVDEVLLDDLDFETLTAAFPEYYQNEKFIRPQTGEPYYSDNISFPNLDDSMSQIGDPEALEDWKDKVRRRFGDVIIKFNNKAKNWFDKVFVDDFEFNFAKEKFIRGKMKALNR